MLDLLWPTAAMAQTTGGEVNPQQRLIANILLILAFFLVVYFMFLRPQQKRQKQVQEMLKNIKNGDRVLTSGGLYGQVLGVKDDVVVLKIADDVKVEVAKSAVQGVVSK
jgi:preprotein translocase subunit YajC